MDLLRQLKIAFVLLLWMILLTGLLYPGLITVMAQLIFPAKANGSMVIVNGAVKGSELIGQPFDQADYFWGRPSATQPYPYNGAQSSGSNMGPINPSFIKIVRERIANLTPVDEKAINVPVDLVTASGSGLDPEISPYAAYYQIPRIAKARGLSEDALVSLVASQIQARTWKILGEPRINVLKLNMALDALRSEHGRATTRSR